jgi:dolichol-phosphate hexosyltransferase
MVEMQILRSQTVPIIQVIIAALNEEEGIGATIAEIQNHLSCPNIVVVDGRSTDRTVEIAHALSAEIYVQDGRGKGNAIAKAIDNLDPAAEYVVITDADYTYPAKYIPDMIRVLDNNPDVGMVCGNRFAGTPDEAAVKSIFYIGNKLIALVHNILNGVPLADPLTGLRVVRASILKDSKIKSNGFDIEVELNNEVERKGFSIVELPIDYRARLGEKKLRVRDGAQIFSRMFTSALMQ